VAPRGTARHQVVVELAPEDGEIEHREARGRAGIEQVDEQALAGEGAAADELDREVVAAGAVLNVGAGVEDGREPTIHVVHIEVGRRYAGVEVIVLGPDEDWRIAAAELHQDRVAAVAEVVQVRSREGSRVRGGTGQEVAFPGARGPVGLVPFVARGGEVEDAGGRDRVDRLRHDSVLEGRLVEVDDVVDDDVAPIGGQVEDVLREARLADARRRVAERRAGSEVMDDLEHRRAFVAGARLPRQHVDSRQVARRLHGRQRIDAIRQRADLHSQAGGAEEASRPLRIVGLVTLGDVDRVGHPRHFLPHLAHRRHSGERLEIFKAHAGVDLAVGVAHGLDRGPERRQLVADLLDRGSAGDHDVDRHLAVGLGLHEAEVDQGSET
jgi:hypothetical protein